MPTCPSCGHTWDAPKRVATPVPAPDLSTLSTKALYAYYKRTAPAEDVAFVRRYAPYVVLPENCTSSQAFQAFREQSPPSWTRRAPDEAAFWRWHKQAKRRAWGAAFRQQRDQLLHALQAPKLRVWERQTPAQYIQDCADANAERARTLVQTLRRGLPTFAPSDGGA